MPQTHDTSRVVTLKQFCEMNHLSEGAYRHTIRTDPPPGLFRLGRRIRIDLDRFDEAVHGDNLDQK